MHVRTHAHYTLTSYMLTYTHMRMHTHIHTRIHAHTHMYTHIHAHIATCTQHTHTYAAPLHLGGPRSL